MFFIITLLSLQFFAFCGCKKNEDDGPKLRMAKVEKGDLKQVVVATGRIKPINQIEIRSKSGGTVRRIFVEEGDLVQKGQKLLEIAPESSPSEQVRTREELNTAKVGVNQAKDNLRISKELYEKGLVPEQNYLDAQRDLERAQARLTAAEAEWSLIQREQIGQVDYSEQDIVKSSTTVVAPISGIIFTREVDAGASVTPTTSASGGTLVMTMGDDREIEFRGDVDEADIGKLKVGLGVNLTVQAYPSKEFQGKITHISPVGRIDKEERQTVFSVRALMDNSENALKVGLSATAKIVVDERKNVPLIDEMALNFKGDTVFVKVVTDSSKGTTEEKIVKMGISDGLKSEVTDGLSGGELISLGAMVTTGDK